MGKKFRVWHKLISLMAGTATAVIEEKKLTLWLSSPADKFGENKITIRLLQFPIALSPSHLRCSFRISSLKRWRIDYWIIPAYFTTVRCIEHLLLLLVHNSSWSTNKRRWSWLTSFGANYMFVREKKRFDFGIGFFFCFVDKGHTLIASVWFFVAFGSWFLSASRTNDGKKAGGCKEAASGNNNFRWEK